MITSRNLIILAAVLVVLAGVSFMQKSQHRKETNTSATEIVVQGEFNGNNMSRISLGFGEDHEAVVLASTTNGWVIESHHQAAADDQRISTLLKNLSNLGGEFRSDSGKILGQYGLSDNQAVTIRGLNAGGDEVIAVNLGKTPQGSQGQFMRTPGSNKVYLSQAGVLPDLGIYGTPEPPKAQYFMALQAVRETPSNLDGVVIRNGDSTLSFTKKYGAIEPAEGAAPTIDYNTWQWILDNQPADDLDKTKIDRVMSACAGIRANDVADPTVSDADFGLEKPTRSMTLIRQDGSTLTVDFGNTREASASVTAGTFMRVSDSPTIWVVTDYSIKNIFQSRDELKAE